MLKIDFSRKSIKFLEKLPQKQFEQIDDKLEELRKNPLPHDSKKLKGLENTYYRVDMREYRTIYHFDNITLFIDLVGKRNDDEVYKIFFRSH